MFCFEADTPFERYVYDLHVPAMYEDLVQVQPKPVDGEVESFKVWDSALPSESSSSSNLAVL